MNARRTLRSAAAFAVEPAVVRVDFVRVVVVVVVTDTPSRIG
ncbi:hypothetical protein [Dechloromonas sp.]|nr:hypothetical protein [Dechloromonas sp.]